MFENLKIRQRLKKAFAIIVVISSIAGVLGALAMIVTMNRYQHALTNYGFSQGDIGKAMTVFTDVRSATRGIIGYNDPDLVDGLITTHDEKKQAFLEYWEVVGETVVSSKEKELYDQVNEQIVLADGKTQEEVEEQAVALILGEKKPEPGEKETAEKPKKVSAFCNFWREIAVSDMVIGILGLCAIGLIIIPELVYVRDIYEESYARSNTMFKLTYQADRKSVV